MRRARAGVNRPLADRDEATDREGEGVASEGNYAPTVSGRRFTRRHTSMMTSSRSKETCSGMVL
jgi:hypothetical protein